MMRDAEARFWEKVNKGSETDCWTWASPAKQRGYGKFWFEGRVVNAHRFAYELLVAPIPAGLVIDHLCRNRGCVNPAHMEPVTIGENVMRGESVPAQRARQTHCIHAHPFVEGNIYWENGGRTRKCATCEKAKQKRMRADRLASADGKRLE